MDRLGSADRRIGTEIAGYRVEAVLSCRLSESLLAVEPLSRRAVVLKLIDVELARDQGLGARLEQIGVGFRDPLDGSIARVLELREEPERLILVREWVDGDDVAALLEGQALCDPDIAIGLVAQAALCLHGARWTSTDGTTWSRLIPGSAATDVFATSQGKPARMNAVTAGGPGLVAVGTDGSNAAVWTSVDGMSWSRVPHEDAIFGGEADQEIKSVALADVGLVAVGTDGSRAAVWASTGGRSWVRVPDSGRQSGGDAESIESLTSGGPGVVAVGADRVRGSFRAAVWTSP
jgi:hypothetical protein